MNQGQTKTMRPHVCMMGIRTMTGIVAMAFAACFTMPIASMMRFRMHTKRHSQSPATIKNP